MSKKSTEQFSNARIIIKDEQHHNFIAFTVDGKMHMYSPIPKDLLYLVGFTKGFLKERENK